MKAAKFGLEEITSENIITVNIDGEKVEGEYERHSEVYIHSEVLRARPDVNAVIHTHAPYTVMFSALGVPLQPIGHPGSIFSSRACRSIPGHYRAHHHARSAAKGSHGRWANTGAMILQNHGLVTAADQHRTGDLPGAVAGKCLHDAAVGGIRPAVPNALGEPERRSRPSASTCSARTCSRQPSTTWSAASTANRRKPCPGAYFSAGNTSSSASVVRPAIGARISDEASRSRLKRHPIIVSS